MPNCHVKCSLRRVQCSGRYLMSGKYQNQFSCVTAGLLAIFLKTIHHIIFWLLYCSCSSWWYCVKTWCNQYVKCVCTDIQVLRYREDYFDVLRHKSAPACHSMSWANAFSSRYWNIAACWVILVFTDNSADVVYSIFLSNGLRFL